MTSSAEKIAKKDAENFHVLPKKETVQDIAKPSAAANYAAEDQSLNRGGTRDSEAGSVTGNGDATGVNQSRTDETPDRSRVS